MPLVPQLIIAPTDKGVMWGDSITAGGWYLPLIAMGATASDIGNAPGRGGYYQKNNPPPVTWIQSGGVGNTAADIDASVAARLTVYAAQFAFGEWGINDILLATSDVSFAASNNSAWDKALLAQPTLKVACCSIFCDQENIPNSTEANIDAKNAIMAATMARVGGTFVDVRTPLLAWELINNPAHDPSGHLTVDGIHPNTLGNFLWSQWAYPYVRYSGR